MLYFILIFYSIQLKKLRSSMTSVYEYIPPPFDQVLIIIVKISTYETIHFSSSNSSLQCKTFSVVKLRNVRTLCYMEKMRRKIAKRFNVKKKMLWPGLCPFIFFSY